MAADTAAKRFAFMGLRRRGLGNHLPLPDGTIAAGDRAGLLWLYTGILPANVATGPFRAQALQIKVGHPAGQQR